MARDRQMFLMTSAYPFGGHLGGWRHPTAFPEFVMSLDAIVDVAKLAERGKMHSLFLADGNAVRQMDKKVLFENVAPSDRPASFEPFTLMAALSQLTEHIGLFVTATTTYDEPYHLARKFASLDHLSGGRAVWNVVTGSNPGDSVNFGDAELPDRHERYARAVEAVEVCKGLWDSWATDAFPQDKATGKFLDSTRVHTLNHEGEFFSIKGPLNVARSPQGYPAIFMAGQSEPGREFAAKHADALFMSAHSKEEAMETYADIKSRMAKFGRKPEDLIIVPGMGANVFPTKEEALALNRELSALVAPELAIQHLSSQIFFDLSGYDPNGPLPEAIGQEEARGVTSIRTSIYQNAKEKGFTILETAMDLERQVDDPPFTGTPAEVADQMQDWFESEACDGFMIGAPVLPAGLERIVDLLIPELQRRGIYRSEYPEGTLRQQWGIEQFPESPFFGAEAATA